MKHAILILAHKNIQQLIHLIEYFSKDCYVFVHIDKKSKITEDEISSLEAIPQVSKVYRRYSVHWGGFSMLKCEMFLLRETLKQCDVDYVHLLSGQDYPIKPLKTFLSFFSMNEGRNFMSYIHVPHATWQANTYSRYQYYYPYDWLDRTERSERRLFKWLNWQRKLGIKRRIPDHFDHIYGGSQWFSITRSAVDILLKYTRKKPAFYRRLKFTFAPEETYITTVLVNILGHKNICPRNYRYIRWKFENNCRPANLGEEHFHLLVETDDLFTRKMETPYCETLIALIDKYLTTDNQLVITDNGEWIYDGYLKYDYDINLINSISRYCVLMDYHSVLDVNCGAGLYVAALRRRGIAIAGCDSNPYTGKLSSLLIPKKDQKCANVSLLDDVGVDEAFDLVISLYSLSYNTKSHINTIVKNLYRLTNHSLIVNLSNDCSLQQKYLDVLSKQGFSINQYITKTMRKFINKDKNIYVLEK